MKYDKKAAWTASLSMIFCGIAIAALQNKVVPCLDAIQTDFSLSDAAGGWLSSLFSVTGILMAFPAALIVNRFGVKRTCLVSLLAGCAGTLLGMTAATAPQLIVSRVLEGVGAGLITVATPMTISAWFPPEKQDFPMGLWASWQPVAQALGNLSVRAISLSMLCFCTACFGFVTWISQCWVEHVGIGLAEADRYISLFAVISIPAIAGTGYLMDRVDHRKFCTFVLPGYALTTCVLFNLCSNVGMLLGPPLTGWAVDRWSWNGAIAAIIISLLGTTPLSRRVRE